MKRIVAVFTVILFSACGVTETATVAATSAAAKAQEAKDAEKTMQQMQNRLDQVNQQLVEKSKADGE